VAVGAVSAASSAEKIKLTYIGDSITSGGACQPESYVSDLQDMLGSKYDVTNAGVSGHTMLKTDLCGSTDNSTCSYLENGAR